MLTRRCFVLYIWAVTLLAAVSTGTPAVSTSIEFRATYIRIVDADGSNLTGILLPANPDLPAEQILPSDLAINRDGSRAFFVTPWTQHRIYKVESGTIVEILDTADWADIVASVSRPQVRTTWDGQYVYFQEDRDDIWRVHHNGGTPSLVVDDKTVLRNGGLEGWVISDS